MSNPARVAVITGGSRGVGRAIALALAERGYAVAINYRDSTEQAGATLSELRGKGVDAMAIQADTADDADCRRLVAEAVSRLGRLDVLINNAATTQFVPHDNLEALDTALWDRIFAVNVRGPFQCIRAARPHLEASGAGHVINITSIAAILANGSSIPYCASKAALINLTQSLARALAPKVRVNSVAPGFIESQWTHEGLGLSYEKAVQHSKAVSALGEICQPEDVADAVLGLLFGSRLVTGQTLVVDAGRLIGPKG